MSVSPGLALSSGDLVADRRFEHARAYAAAGERAAAAELTEQALELVPTWAAGWFELGDHREAAGLDGAAEAYDRALALDPTDRCGAALRLARLGVRPAPPVPPPAHVRDLFDAYAPRFEESLVDRLGYRGPELLLALLDAEAPGRRFARALDLGCGTGLMGRALRARVDRLEGQDLAPAMVETARGRGGYDALSVGDAHADLARRPAGAHDLVTAADVFCYLGDLAPITAGVARVLAPGGLFAFTAESAGAGGETVLRASLRYAHGRTYLETVAREAGLAVLRHETGPLRRDRSVDLPASAVLLTKS